MLWVEMEVNSGAVKHMVELIWCVDEVDDTTLADLHDIWWFWWRLHALVIDREVSVLHNASSARAGSSVGRFKRRK